MFVRPLPLLVVSVYPAALGFRLWQNHHGAVGGEISLAKALWLATAIVCFLVIPGALARRQRVYRWFFGGFLLRSAVEIPLLLWTRGWRCEFGIAHNFAMLAVLWAMPGGGAFRWLLSLVLLFESLNAWLFSRAADPAMGVYFAGESAHFRLINLITWLELATVLPALALWLFRSSKP